MSAMTPDIALPADPGQVALALVALLVAGILILRIAAALFSLYLFGIGALYLRGWRLASNLFMVVGGMVIGALGVATYHGVLALIGWLL